MYMRILVLTKRQYMSKDLLDDQYGRFFELPRELARRGHQVVGLCLSYRPRKEGHLLGPDIDNSIVDWYSVNLGRLIIPGLIDYWKRLEAHFCEFKPDIIYACSDAPHVIQGVRVARKHSIPCIVDLYDNFESFALTGIPGILPLFKRAVGNAPGVSCISSALKRYVEEQYNPKGTIRVLQNGIPAGQFYPLNRRQCRKELGLPIDAKLIGTAGALGSNRGIEILFKAAGDLIDEDSSIHLVMAGPLESGTVLPEGANIHYLGKLEYEQVPILFNALDVGIICNRDSSFGRYCFPQKAYEMLACDISVVAADVGTMSELFFDHPEYLYTPKNKQSLVRAVRKQLVCPTSYSIEIRTWADIGKDLESFLLAIAGHKKQSVPGL